MPDRSSAWGRVAGEWKRLADGRSRLRGDRQGAMTLPSYPFQTELKEVLHRADRRSATGISWLPIPDRLECRRHRGDRPVAPSRSTKGCGVTGLPICGRDAGRPGAPRTDPSERNYRTGLPPQVRRQRRCSGQGCTMRGAGSQRRAIRHMRCQVMRALWLRRLRPRCHSQTTRWWKASRAG